MSDALKLAAEKLRCAVELVKKGSPRIERSPRSRQGIVIILEAADELEALAEVVAGDVLAVRDEMTKAIKALLAQRAAMEKERDALNDQLAIARDNIYNLGLVKSAQMDQLIRMKGERDEFQRIAGEAREETAKVHEAYARAGGAEPTILPGELAMDRITLADVLNLPQHASATITITIPPVNHTVSHETSDYDTEPSGCATCGH